MIISPPYLLSRHADELDEDWIRRCMPAGLPGDGAYPLGHALQWHGGVHLMEPEANAQVRAIADGKVVFKRDPVPQPNGVLPADHPQGYFGGWTDNGVVIIEHTTEIGEGPNATVTFFSIYMHLREIDSKLKKNDQVYRKAPLGRAGSVFGETRRLHFEIVCDDLNLRKLVGRSNGSLNTDRSGRTDAVYGALHFRLPAGTAIYAAQPLANNPTAHYRPATPASVSRNTASSVPVALQPAYTTIQELFVCLRYAGGNGSNLPARREQRSENTVYKGDAVATTLQVDGAVVGAPLIEPDAEYDLYINAVSISKAYPANARPSPSAIYELLRFGRVIGPDVLNPVDVPHWRRISYPGGTGWVNLNAANITKYSDADFPHWMGWNLVDDSADLDSRCDSPTIKQWLDVNGDGRVTPAEALVRMTHASVAPKLAKAICKIPTEWDAETFDVRLNWIKTSTLENPIPVDEKNFDRMREYVTALAFWPGNMGLPKSHWHWNPSQFIEHFRRCGWLSQREMTQCVPRVSPAGLVPLSTATARIQTWRLAINKMARKFTINSAARITHLLAQIWAETGYLRLTRESDAEDARYAPYVGRGLIQITWQDKYEAYRSFCLLPMTFDIELIATDQHHAGNSSGFYWVSKEFYEPARVAAINLSRLADLGTDVDSIGRLCLWVNGGGNHYDHRHIHVLFIKNVLDDIPREKVSKTETVNFRKMEFLREVVTRDNRTTRVIRGTQKSVAMLAITVNHTPQI